MKQYIYTCGGERVLKSLCSELLLRLEHIVHPQVQLPGYCIHGIRQRHQSSQGESHARWV